jgi:hypothetical protein
MAFVQNKNRDGKLKSGPLSKYSSEAEEAQAKDRKNQAEALKRRFEQERSMQTQKSRDAESLQKIEMYKRRQTERKRMKMSGAVGGRLFGSAKNRGLSGTLKAQMGRHEGGTTSKG